VAHFQLWVCEKKRKGDMEPAKKTTEDDECIEKLAARFFTLFLKLLKIWKKPIRCPSCDHSFSVGDHKPQGQVQLSQHLSQEEIPRVRDWKLWKRP